MSTDLTTTGGDNEVALPIAPTFDAKGYVAAVFDPFKRQIAKAKREASKVDAYDITTTAGMSKAKELRAMFRDIRTGVENTRKERKAPIIESGKLLDARASEIKAEVEPFEDKYDREIKDEETRKEAEKQRKLTEERARIEAIENRIAHIRNATTRHLKSDSAAIAKEIEQYTVLRLDPADYQELLEDALNAVNKTLDDLETMRLQAVEIEAAQRKAEEDARELARLREETAARERREAEEKAQRDAAEKLKADEAAAATAAQAKRIADLEAQLAAAQKPIEPDPAPAPVVAPQADLLAETATITNTDVQPAGTEPSSVFDSLVTHDGAGQKSPAVETAWRPSDEAILNGLARSFGIAMPMALRWLEDMDLPALRVMVGE